MKYVKWEYEKKEKPNVVNINRFCKNFYYNDNINGKQQPRTPTLLSLLLSTENRENSGYKRFLWSYKTLNFPSFCGMITFFIGGGSGGGCLLYYIMPKEVEKG